MEPILPGEEILFETALKLSEGQRVAYLDKACAGDTDLRCRVEGLLLAFERAAGFMEQPAVRTPHGNFEKTLLTERAGDRIGRYKLLEQIGEGGCGVVYVAEQEEPVRRRVALKVIKLGMDTKQVIARFEAERQALAMMDHPNIAKILDAGVTESPLPASGHPLPSDGRGAGGEGRPHLSTGRPFFVMELVRGIKITDYCEQNGLPVRERLDLFIQVCRAIQHAHQKGVIHRDIKPSNLLVTVNDGVAVPKVIDFGIAKATQGRLTDQTVYTAFEQFIGTPAYMSPEQAVMTSLDIDTRSDIYSLGVLLYELLTGKTPFDAKELLASGLDEMRRTIREVEPLKPSTRLTRELAAAATPGADSQSAILPISNRQSQENACAPCENERRQTGSTAIQQVGNLRYKELIHVLRGDLDWIVMKCLDKDRRRRYETANGLATDIQRHLDNEPINARPPSKAYRFQKLFRRNKFAFVAIAAMAGTALASLVILLISNFRISAARKAEQGERQKSDAANRQLQATVNMLELQRAEDHFGRDDPVIGAAHLASILRQDPLNQIAASRLSSALLHRNWALATLKPLRHPQVVETACFSPDGRQVLTACWDGIARVWDAGDGHVIARLPHKGRVISASYSPDGLKIVTGSWDRTVRFWSATNGVELFPALKHGEPVYGVEFSRDGHYVLSGSTDQTARLWDAANGALLREFRHDSAVLFARLSSDGGYVAAAGRSGVVRMWRADSAELVFQSPPQHGGINALAFSPNGQQLLIAYAEGSMEFYDVHTGQLLGRMLAHNVELRHAIFSPHGEWVLSSSQDGTARFWDAITRARVGQRLLHEGPVRFGDFSTDGKKVLTVSLDNSVRVWDVETGMLLCQPLRESEQSYQASFSKDGGRLVTASLVGAAQVWDLRPRRCSGIETAFAKPVASVAFSPDGNSVIAGSLDGTVRLVDVRSGGAVPLVIEHKLAVTCVEFSPDNRLVATASEDGTAQLWDLAKGRLTAKPLQHAKKIYTAHFNFDGSHLVTASVDRTARVWDTRTGAPLTPPLVHNDEVNSAQFSPDAKLIVTASDDHSARVWNAVTGKAVTEPLRHGDMVYLAEFSLDSQKVVTASSDNSARIWDVCTGQAIARLQHTRTVAMASFSPDGRRVATASHDQTARVWDLSTGQALTPPLKHDSAVTQARFSPDGARILTADLNGKARLWDPNTGLPLTEWLEIGGRVFDARFDPKGRRIATAADSLRLWDVQTPPTPVPNWFPDFAEAVAGARLASRGNLELVPRAQFHTFAARFESADANLYYDRLAQWFLKAPDRRSPEP